MRERSGPAERNVRRHRAKQGKLKRRRLADALPAPNAEHSDPALGADGLGVYTGDRDVESIDASLFDDIAAKDTQTSSLKGKKRGATQALSVTNEDNVNRLAKRRATQGVRFKSPIEDSVDFDHKLPPTTIRKSTAVTTTLNKDSIVDTLDSEGHVLIAGAPDHAAVQADSTTTGDVAVESSSDRGLTPQTANATLAPKLAKPACEPPPGMKFVSAKLAVGAYRGARRRFARESLLHSETKAELWAAEDKIEDLQARVQALESAILQEKAEKHDVEAQVHALIVVGLDQNVEIARKDKLIVAKDVVIAGKDEHLRTKQAIIQHLRTSLAHRFVPMDGAWL